MYSSQAELEAALTATLVGQAAVDAEGEFYPAIIEDVIQRASGLVDSYVSRRYPVPLAPVPAIVRTQATHIAAYYLLSRHGFDQEKDSAITRLYKDAMAWLEDVSAGRAQLPDVGGGPAAPAAGVAWSSRPMAFDPDTLRRH